MKKMIPQALPMACLLRFRHVGLVAAAIGLLSCPQFGTLTRVTAQQSTRATAEARADQTARNEAFSKKFSGAKLRGLFTIDGKPMTDLKDEAYEIVRATKMPAGDKWTLESRIKYGKHDLVVPVFLDVKWAGDTPVLTLDKITIPGLGTFSARVVLHEDKYAGTWQHDDVGGHLFGKIEFATDKVDEPESPNAEVTAPEATK